MSHRQDCNKGYEERLDNLEGRGEVDRAVIVIVAGPALLARLLLLLGLLLAPLLVYEHGPVRLLVFYCPARVGGVPLALAGWFRGGDCGGVALCLL